MSDHEDDYNWDSKGPEIAIKPIRGVAVYLNADGDVVIRQQKAIYHDDEPFLVIPLVEISPLIARLQSVVSEAWDHENDNA
jgi:hypothetical protein